VIVNRNSIELDFVEIRIHQRDPNNIIDVTLAIKASELEITSILSHADGEHFVVDQTSFTHNVKYRPHMWVESLLCHAKNTIGFLSEEKIGLLLDTSESEIECVFWRMMVFTKVHQILYKKSSVAASLTVCLSEGTLVSIYALAAIGMAIIEVLSDGLIHLKVSVHVTAALVAIVLARHGYNSTTSIDNQWLFLPVRSHKYIDKEILQFCWISIERTWLQMHMPHPSRYFTSRDSLL
jgi:hypothetical protein